MKSIFSRPRDTGARLVEPRPVDLSNHDLSTAGTSASVVLHIAEGWRRRGRAQSNPLLQRRGEIARGSAAEALAVMMIADLPGCEAQAEKLRRVDRMLERLGG